jgi:hypothetical protein
MLAGRLHGTAPYGWTREVTSLPEYIRNTVQRLGGAGLSDDERAALASYLERMPAPVPETEPADLVKGRELFAQEGCGTCHGGATSTDNTPHALVHNDESIDTPSLRFVGLTAPYFHDGRYQSLDELLRDPKSGMGTTSKLSDAERTDLSKFLRSL